MSVKQISSALLPLRLNDVLDDNRIAKTLTEGDCIEYNIKLADNGVLFGGTEEELSNVSTFERKYSILRKPSPALDAIEFINAGKSLGYTLDQDDQKLYDELSVAALDAFMSPTDIILLSEIGGLQKFAIYDEKKVRRVINEKEGTTTLQFDEQPIILHRYVGATLDAILKAHIENNMKIPTGVTHDNAK